MSLTPSKQSNAGIVENGGRREIPGSVRPDGSIRKAIKIRPGFRPVEDVERYKPPQTRSQRQKELEVVPSIQTQNTVPVLDRSPSPSPSTRRNSQLSQKTKIHPSSNHHDKEIQKTDNIDKNECDNIDDDLTSKLSNLQIGSMASIYASEQPVAPKKDNDLNKAQDRGKKKSRGHISRSNRGRGRGRGRG